MMRRTSPSLFPLLLLIAATDLAEARAKEEALKSLTKHKVNAMNGELRESKAHLEAAIRGQRQKLIGARVRRPMSAPTTTQGNLQGDHH